MSSPLYPFSFYRVCGLLRNVNIGVGQTDLENKQTDRQTDKQTDGKTDYAWQRIKRT